MWRMTGRLNCTLKQNYRECPVHTISFSDDGSIGRATFYSSDIHLCLAHQLVGSSCVDRYRVAVTNVTGRVEPSVVGCRVARWCACEHGAVGNNSSRGRDDRFRRTLWICGKRQQYLSSDRLIVATMLVSATSKWFYRSVSLSADTILPIYPSRFLTSAMASLKPDFFHFMAAILNLLA